MRLRQYSYFSIKSDRRTSDEIAAYLSLDPDEAMVRGSKSIAPERPATHGWMIVCRDTGLAVDEQVDRIVDRLYPYALRIGELAADSATGTDDHCTMTLQVVREFGHGDHDGQVGWHLDARVLDFLQLTHAELDIDEYYFSD